MGVTGHESVFHAVGDAPAKVPEVGAHASARPDTEGCARPAPAHDATRCREVSEDVSGIADRRGAFEEAAPPRECPSADVRPSHVVHPFVPPDIKGRTPEPASSQAEDLGARGGQARPLHLPASRNLVATRDRAAERSLRAVIECLM